MNFKRVRELLRWPAAAPRALKTIPVSTFFRGCFRRSLAAEAKGTVAWKWANSVVLMGHFPRWPDRA